MHLKSLELSGFKSFAKKCFLQFDQPVSAIVGPNGSGKSNIAEAFRFALGEQSIKSMRGRKGEDLIWNGSPELGKSNRASVKIVFDNKKKVINVDFDEVAIERVVFRDGTNQYFLNGSQVRLRDILELISPIHIGASGHHIISQGEADKILNANIRERRAMIEDALGLKIFQYKKQESQRKLEKTEENINQVGSLRNELQPHIRFLKKQFEKLQKTKELRSDLLGLYLEYFSAERSYLTKESAEIKLQKEKPQERLLELRKELDKGTAALKKGPEDEKKQRLLKLDREVGELRIEKDSLLRNLGRIEGQFSSLKKLLEGERKIRQSNTVISSEALEKVREEIADEVERVEKIEDPNYLKGLLRKFLERISVLINRSETESPNLENHRVELEKLSLEKERLERDALKIESQEKERLELLKTLQGEIEKEKDQNRDLEKNIFRLKAEESELLANLSHLKDSEQRILLREEDFDREFKEAKILVGDIVSDFSKNATEFISEEEQQNRRRQIDRIKIKLEDAGGIGAEVEREYQEISDRDAFLERELLDLGNSATSLKQLIKDLEEELNQTFKDGIEKINKRFQELLSIMFDGGTASLVVVKDKRRKRKDDNVEIGEDEDLSPEDEAEYEEEGLDIKISLPRKRIKSLEILSGGERALTSIALIFAVSQVNPPPFLVLDETDAALDEANSKRYGDMLESLAKSSQLVLITHNRETMSRANVLYGVTMGKGGFSKVLSVAFEEAVSVAK